MSIFRLIHYYIGWILLLNDNWVCRWLDMCGCSGGPCARRYGRRYTQFVIQTVMGLKREKENRELVMRVKKKKHKHKAAISGEDDEEEEELKKK